MKTIFRVLKPLIKRLLIAQMKSQQENIINLLLGKIKLNMSGEEEEMVLNNLYDSIEAIIESQIEAV